MPLFSLGYDHRTPGTPIKCAKKRQGPHVNEREAPHTAYGPPDGWAGGCHRSIYGQLQDS